MTRPEKLHLVVRDEAIEGMVEGYESAKDVMKASSELIHVEERPVRHLGALKRGEEMREEEWMGKKPPTGAKVTSAQMAHIRAKHGNDSPRTPSWKTDQEPSWLTARNVFVGVIVALFVGLVGAGVYNSVRDEGEVVRQGQRK